MNPIVSRLVKAGRVDLAKKVQEVLAKNPEPKGRQSLRVIQELQKILPEGWSLNEATSYWIKLPGNVVSEKIQQCVRKPPKNIENADNFCKVLGESMRRLGITTI